MMLSALRLPGNIEGRLADLQAGLFRERGLLSARAFPPLVPLLWTPSPPELAVVDPAPLPPLTIGGLEAGTAGILLGLSPRRPLEDLARHLEEASREDVRGAKRPAALRRLLSARRASCLPARPRVGLAVDAGAGVDAGARFRHRYPKFHPRGHRDSGVGGRRPRLRGVGGGRAADSAPARSRAAGRG